MFSQSHCIEFAAGANCLLLLASLPLHPNSGLTPDELTLAVLRPEEAGPEAAEALDRLVGVCWHTYPMPGGRGWQFEISTDKVDAEIPAPASGVLKEVKVQEGATVQVNTVVGVIDGDGAGAAASAAAPAKPAPPEPAKSTGARSAASTDGPSRPAQAAQPAAPEGDETETESASAASAQPSSKVTEISQREGDRVRSSPLVRKIAKDNNVDLGNVPGTGMGGRITKDDILAFVEKHPAGAPVTAQAQRAATQPPTTRPLIHRSVSGSSSPSASPTIARRSMKSSGS